jgi:aspartate/methionine/tyrosine aminotransferase
LEYDTEAILSAFQDPSALTYEPQPKGLLSARKEVADYYLDDHKASIDPESIILTISTSEAYSFVFKLLCNPLDEILVAKPSYPLYDFLAELQDVALVPYSLQYAHGWMVDFNSVERALTDRTRAILLVHPNNPTGSYLSPQEISRLNAICSVRELALIVDEVFLDYPFYGNSRESFAANREVLTFTLSGLSKISALPQTKVAWLACTGPEELVKAAVERLEVISDTYLSLNTPTQLAVPTLLGQRHSMQKQLSERVRNNRSQLASQLVGHKSCNLLESDGGWYAVLQVPIDKSDEDLAIQLISEQQVIVHPGHFFDFPRDGFLVLSLIASPAEFREGVTRILDSV